MAAGPAQGLDDLLAVAPADFVKARDALAKSLRDQGRSAEAAAVQRLRKPTPAVWAINQAARQDPENLTRFIEAMDHLKRAQLRSPGEVGQATQEQRDALDRVLRSAARALTGIRLEPSTALLDRASATLLGAAADPDGRKELKAGRLTHERAAPGFEIFAGGPLPAGRPAAGTVRRIKAAAPMRREALGVQEKTLERARAEALARRQRAAELETVAAGHREAANQAAKIVKRLEEQLEEARSTARREREAAARSEREARRAREQAERAEAKTRPGERAATRRSAGR